jgi:hypothetical protein
MKKEKEKEERKRRKKKRKKKENEKEEKTKEKFSLLFLSLIIWATVFSQLLLCPRRSVKKKKSHKKLLKYSFSETPKNICISQ